MDRPQTIDVLLKRIQYEAKDVVSLELVSINAGELPQFSAGAHIDLHLRENMMRSYSLANAPSERARYVLGVARDPAGRGGSKFVHENLRVGMHLRVSVPRNNFPLAEEAGYSVLIAGGIGITPLWAMVQHLESIEKRWKLVYCARSAQHAGFLDEIKEFASRSTWGHLVFHFDDEHGGAPLDLQQVVSASGSDAHFYCCGPKRMLDAFLESTANLPASQVHFESFSSLAPPAEQADFEVTLGRTGMTVGVPSGKSILDALLEAGVDCQYGCMQGVCGMCEVGVLGGIPEHRDLVLTDDAKAANRSIMLCCSGSKTSMLVLDM